MIARSAAVFGYHEYAREIAYQLRDIYQDFVLFVLSAEEEKMGLEEGFVVERVDLSDDWHRIEQYFDVSSLVVFCALEDDAQNVFLTISLRSSFEHLHIVALAQDNESAVKMRSAGADKVMPSLQIASNVICDMLEKPVVTKVLHEVLYEEGDLNIIQIQVPTHSSFVQRYLHDIHFKSQYDVILLAVVDHQMGTTFSFASKGHNHHIDPDDIFVVMGHQNKLDALIEAINKEA